MPDQKKYYEHNPAMYFLKITVAKEPPNYGLVQLGKNLELLAAGLIGMGQGQRQLHAVQLECKQIDYGGWDLREFRAVDATDSCWRDGRLRLFFFC